MIIALNLEGNEALDATLVAEELYSAGHKEKAIALQYCRSLIYEKAGPQIERDFARIHGTVVWCLQSGLTNSVEYHIDYAELYRYETNIIHPPLYAGTAHVTPAEISISGGHFAANVDGLEHYKKFGYKGRLVPGQIDEDMRLNKTGSWLHVPFRSNRGILHDGDYPHMSTPVEGISPSEGRRVILGFNCFSAAVGDCCMRAPEHSDAFNRTVKLYQTLAAAQKQQHDEALIGADASSTTTSSTTDTAASSCLVAKVKKNSALSLQDIKKNPALAKLLIAAAKKVTESARTSSTG
jgi:hypothetical protein